MHGSNSEGSVALQDESRLNFEKDEAPRQRLDNGLRFPTA